MTGAARPQGPWRRRLLLFAKEPAPGRVKTRLGRSLGVSRGGMVDAVWWYRRQTIRIMRPLLRDPRWETWIAVSPDAAGSASRFWPSVARRWPQGGGDLGARMGRAFRDFPPGPLLIVGADIPAMRAGHVAAAFAALGSADAVLGPAPDGGYWAIGLRRSPRRAPARLFEDVRWSTPQALTDTERSLAGLRIARTAVLADVDTATDLPRADLARAAGGASAAAPV